MPTTSFKTCGTAVDNNDGKDGPWTSPTNAQGANDTLYASDFTSTNSGVGATNYLKCTNYSFAVADVPNGATINGIQIKVRAHSTNSGTSGNKDLHVFVVKGGVIQTTGTNLAPGQSIATSDTDYNYGSTSTTGGVSFAQSDIISSGFGVAISYSGGSLGGTVSVDSVQIAVTYTAAASSFRRTKPLGKLGTRSL